MNTSENVVQLAMISIIYHLRICINRIRHLIKNIVSRLLFIQDLVKLRCFSLKCHTKIRYHHKCNQIWDDPVIIFATPYALLRYVELLSGQFASMKHVYTYCPLFDKCRRVFLFIQLLEMMLYKDEIFNLNIFRSTGVNWIILLFSIKAAKLYLVPIKQLRNCSAANESKDETNFLNCDWNINFLWSYFWRDFRQACQPCASFQYKQIFVSI